MLKQTVKKFQKDKRGSAMVMVIIAIAFISILIATLFWVTMANFFMKYTDARNKENFYSAETVFEEMKAGVQTRASNELISVYTKSFGDFTNGTSEAELQDRYLNAIYNFYRTDPNHFDPEILIGYVEDLFNAYYDGPVGGAGTAPAGAIRYEASVTSPCEIQKRETEVILKNITVRFSDHDTGYYSEITSDIAVGLPNISFSKSSELPAIFDYAIIADTGLEIDNGVTVVSEKNIYSGKNGILVGSGVGVGSANGAKLDISNTEYVVTRGVVSLNGMSNSATSRAVIKTGKDTRLYAHDIVISNGSGELEGKTYVANDLAYNAPGQMKITGNYFGFGNSTTSANSSSAILINSNHTKLDLKNASSVMLAGHSFVGTSDDKQKQINDGQETGFITVSKNSSDILMDQSISVKGDQIAYLIPGSCIGVWKYNNGATGDALVGMNPVPDVTVSLNALGRPEPYFPPGRFVPESYDINEGHIQTVDFDTPVYALNNKPLKAYSTEYKVMYKTQYGQNLAYFYIVMNEDSAKQYMEDYYGVKHENVDTYFRYYQDNTYLDSTASGNDVVTAGHYLSGPDTENLALSGATSSSAMQNQNSMDLASVYNALCTKLVTDSASVKATELTNTVYQNIIDETKMPAGLKEYSIGSGTDKVRAIVTGGDFDYGTDASHKNIHLIIAAGDVKIEDDFSGIIIAKGTVTINNDGGGEKSVSFGGNRDAVIRLLQNIYLEGGTPDKKVLEYFKDGTKYVLEGTEVSGNTVPAEDQRINFGDLVRYENWAKK